MLRKVEYIKGVIRSRKSKKNKQNNGKKQLSRSNYGQLSNLQSLPSGRLLQYYRQFDKQESGWNYENINQMNQDFEKNSNSIQSKLGVLIFDEIKIKEVFLLIIND